MSHIATHAATDAGAARADADPSVLPDPVMDFSALQDFDIVLFRGRGFWFSYVVEYATWSDFSHIGLFLRGAEDVLSDLKQPLLLESGQEAFPDAVEHKIKWGVQLSDLSMVINNYDGDVFYRKLLVSDDVRAAMKKQLIDVYNEIQDRAYDAEVRDLLRVALDADVGDCQRTNKFFCSALVSYVFVKMGLLTDDIKWDLIRPKDYATEYMSALLKDAKFGPLTQMTPVAAP